MRKLKREARKIDLQRFAAPTNTIITTDLEPAISIDFASRLSTNIAELQQLLGITEMIPMSEGTAIKIYKMTQVNTPDQVGEGETINLTEIRQELAKTVTLTLKKYRKSTTAEAIQKSGRALAVNRTDEKLLTGIQGGIKKDFYALLATGTGAVSGTTLQNTLSAAWAKVKSFYQDQDATPIYFVSSDDVGDYLGNASITMQTAFGMSYIENFLGLGTVIVTPALAKGKIYATAKENLNGAYIPATSGDLAQSFNLSGDATGMIGMTHYIVGSNAVVETLAMSGVVFFPELLDGVIVGTISGE